MITRLEKRLLNRVGRASQDWELIAPGDHILVALSGGKDSYAMAYLLQQIQRRVPFDVKLTCTNLDQHQPGFEQEVIVNWCDARGLEHHMLSEDTYSIVLDKVPEGKTYCSLCSRLRRGILYAAADRLGCNKIALGHHRDDLIETLLLNLFFSGQVKSMAPRLEADNGRHVVIRPLVYCDEAEVEAFSEEQAFPILPCNLCGSQDNLQRKKVKRMISEMTAENANVRGNLFAALQNIVPSHLLDPTVRRVLAASEGPSLGK